MCTDLKEYPNSCNSQQIWTFIRQGCEWMSNDFCKYKWMNSLILKIEAVVWTYKKARSFDPCFQNANQFNISSSWVGHCRCLGVRSKSHIYDAGLCFNAHLCWQESVLTDRIWLCLLNLCNITMGRGNSCNIPSTLCKSICCSNQNIDQTTWWLRSIYGDSQLKLCRGAPVTSLICGDVLDQCGLRQWI